jgi:TolA-binding protein
MPRRHAVLLALCALATPGCFLTRAVGLGPDPGPDEIADTDPPETKYEKAQHLFAASEWSDAAYAFHRVWTDHPKSDLASDAQFYEADARYGQGKYNGAFELYKRYLKDWPLSPHAPVIQRRIYEMGTYTVEAGKHGFLGIFGYSDEGVDELDYLVSTFPHGDLADDALVYMADYEWKDRQTHAAIDHLHDLIDNYPLSEWALEGRLRLGRAYRDLNRGTRYDADSLQRSAAEYRAYIDLVKADRDRAREYEDRLRTARSELSEVEELLARKRIEASDFYLRMGKTAAARAELRNVIRDYPRSEAAGEAREELGTEPAAKDKGEPRDTEHGTEPGAGGTR